MSGGFSEVRGVSETARLLFEPARSGVISWNTFAAIGRIEFRLLRADTRDVIRQAPTNADGRCDAPLLDIAPEGGPPALLSAILPEER